MSWNALTGDVDALIDSLNQQVAQLEYVSAGREIPSQDGYGGLIRICDDYMFREQGFISVYVPPTLSSPTSSPATTSSAANTLSASGESECTMESFRESQSLGRRSAPSAPLPSTEARSSKMGEVSMSVRKSDSLSGGRCARSLSSLPTVSKPSFRSQDSTAVMRPTSQVELRGGAGGSGTSSGGGARNVSGFSRAEQNSRRKYGQQSREGRHKEVRSQVDKLQSQLEILRSGGVPEDQRRVRAASIADEAFRAAAAKLRENGDYSEAVQLAEIAAGACPPDKLAARVKINRLKQVAINKLQAS
ncbi:hypothetical protein BSKO_03993 [Bryopsis sp. KO-2023]|nr:hypothetical protein BSKO_03993 [Bryopsis sp. KO-2023]